MNPIAISMTDMDVKGDIRHEDYQRRMTVMLENTTLTGNIVSGTMEDWNSRWSEYGAVNWVVDERYDTVYGVELTVGADGVWNVTGASSLRCLTLEEGAALNGVDQITLNGELLTPEPGETYTGDIQISGSYEPEQEATEETPKSIEDTASVVEPVMSAEPEPEASANPEPDTQAETPQKDTGVSPALVAVILVVVAAVIVAVSVVVIKKKKGSS